MIIVYRVENEHGEGPFRGEHGSLSDHIAKLYSGKYGSCYPIPSYDKFDKPMRCVHSCGCESLERLLHWFPEDCHAELTEYGYCISVFAIDDDAELVRGQHQIGFDRECAYLLKTMSFSQACVKLKLVA